MIQDAIPILETQLEKEERLLEIYQQSNGLIGDSSLSDDLGQLVEDKGWHIRRVEDIILKLRGE